jgi:hypothetical protein
VVADIPEGKRMQQRQSNRRVWATLLIAAVIVGLATSASGGRSAVQPASPGEDSYRLSNFTIQYPLIEETPAGPQSDPSHARIGFDVTWSGSEYPGEAACELQAFDADQTLVGALQFDLIAPLQQALGPNDLPVPVDAKPTSVAGVCAVGDRPSDGYGFSNVRVEKGEAGPRLVGTIEWLGESPPGLNACTAHLVLPDAQEVEHYFELSSGPEKNGTIALLPTSLDTATVASIDCEPYVSPRPQDVPTPDPSS